MSWLQTGWQVFDPEPRLFDWLAKITPAALATADDPAHAQWHRHGGTWFAGVDVLENDAEGRSGTSGRLTCQALEEAERITGRLPLHKAQISITYPGYPQQDPDESDANHRFRKTRDAAHLDGLLPIGPKRRRMIREPHGYILGLPLTENGPNDAPLVVWDGSHEVMRHAMRRALQDEPPEQWHEVDVTEAYHAARRHCFDTLDRVEVTAMPGQAILLHRLTLHGVAPWSSKGSTAPVRAIAYFRPELPGGVFDWVTLA